MRRIGFGLGALGAAALLAAACGLPTEESGTGNLRVEATVTNAAGAATLTGVRCVLDGESIGGNSGAARATISISVVDAGSHAGWHLLELFVLQESAAPNVYRFTGVSCVRLRSDRGVIRETDRVDLPDLERSLAGGGVVRWGFQL